MGMKNVIYDYASVSIEVPEPLATEIINWGMEHVPDKNLTQGSGTGREDEMHITILYGIHSDNPAKIKKLMANQESIEIELGEVELFCNNPKYDVIVIDISSDRLNELNKKLKDNVGHTERYGLYQPHITIAYVKKGKGHDLEGSKRFKGMKFNASAVLFSPRIGSKEYIAIK